MSGPIATPPVTLSFEQANHFGPYSFSALALGLRERYITTDVLRELVDDKVAEVSDPDVLSKLSLLWKAYDSDDLTGGTDSTIAALETLSAIEPLGASNEGRRPWFKAFVKAVLDRYRDPLKALQAMDILYAVLRYPEELVDLTTYRRDRGVPVGERTVAENRVKAMRRFLLS